MARYIDADALDEKLDELMKRYAAQGRKQVAEDYNFVRTVLLTAPTIEARPVVWWPGISLIMTGEEMLYRCSNCDAKYADVEGYKFCPKCGADMRPKEEANED